MKQKHRYFALEMKNSYGLEDRGSVSNKKDFSLRDYVHIGSGSQSVSHPLLREIPYQGIERQEHKTV
jgi:hypothetical protein